MPGITVLTGAPISMRCAFALGEAGTTRAHGRGAGGWHPSMSSRECLSERSVDVTVRGQGEETFAEIVQRLAQGRPLDDCAGCTVRLTDGTIQENPARPLAQVDKFRPHDYGLIPVERYFELKGKRQGSTSSRPKVAISGAAFCRTDPGPMAASAWASNPRAWRCD